MRGWIFGFSDKNTMNPWGPAAVNAWGLPSQVPLSDGKWRIVIRQ
jgi:hypothetical protein